MSDKYILNGHEPIPCDDLLAWGRWMEIADRTVATDIIGNTRVSTVFLGLDHSFLGKSPILFETMIFGGSEEGYQERYSTWEEAEEGHKRSVARIQDELAMEVHFLTNEQIEAIKLEYFIAGREGTILTGSFNMPSDLTAQIIPKFPTLEDYEKSKQGK